MRIDDTNPMPVPALEPERRKPAQKAEGATAPGQGNRATPAYQVAQHTPAPSGLSVVVEAQKDNQFVYKFIDESTGEVIQQIPSSAILAMAEAINSILQAQQYKDTAPK
jgi:hypothetical protein